MHAYTHFFMFKVLELLLGPVLEKARGGSGWTVSSAQGLRDHSSTAQPVPVESTPAHMLKMLGSGVSQVYGHMSRQLI